MRRLAVRVFEWRRFGFGIVLTLCLEQLLSASKRGSTQIAWHEHVSRLRLMPHTGHKPWQSARHNGFIGTAR